jgi:putative NADH-flavin reductase
VVTGQQWQTHFRRKSSMTILITGGTGLVGSRLLRRFVDAGVDCRALVRPGKEVPAGATPVEGDLLDADSLKHAVEGVSAIVHLAAVFRTQNEDDIWRANLDGTKNLIAAAKAHAPQARFVMASTGLVYDAGASHPGLEDDATNPKLAYPASKIAAENELRNSGLNWSILRLGFVYGDGDGHLASVPPIDRKLHHSRLRVQQFLLHLTDANHLTGRQFHSPTGSPPSPNSATVQTIPGETGSHDPGCCDDEVFTSVAIVSVVVAAAVPLGVTVAGEKLHVEFAGSPLHTKLTA